MKTKIITELKKEILVVEDSDELDFYEITPRILAFNMKDGSIKIFKGNYTLLGKVDEIKEEDVLELVEGVGIGWFEDYQDKKNGMFKTALESFLSAIEKEIYWVNPLGESKPNKSYFLDDNGSFLRQEKKQWEEAQEKTFDRNRVEIFVKN